MPLIEGLGDEVTIILTLLTIIIVLLIAWLSTHTRDIPFFSVIVVELSQRAARNHQSRSQSPDNQIQSIQESNESTSNVETLVSQQQTIPEPSLVTESSVQGKVNNTSGNLQNLEGGSGNESVPSAVPQIEETSQSNEESVSERTSAVSNTTQDTKKLHSLADTKSAQDCTTAGDSDESVSSRDCQTYSGDSQESSTSVTERGTVSQPSSQTSDLDVTEVRHRNVPSTQSAPSSESNPSSATSVTTSPTTTTAQGFLESANEDHMGQIRIRLKYLNDTQRLVYSSPTDTIGQFRRAHFSTELAANKLVRLIFNGQDMRNDTNTLQGYNITDNSVIHCLITQNLQRTAQPHTDNNDGDVQLGSFMMPLFAVILAAFWYLRITQRQYFNAVSTLSLAGVTFLFLLGCASVWRTGGNREHQHVD